MAVKIHAFSADLFIIAPSLGLTDIEIELICRHKGSAESQYKSGNKDPCTGDIAGNKKITAYNTEDDGHHQGKTKLPDKGEISEYLQPSVFFFVIRKTYLRQNKTISAIVSQGKFLVNDS